ncbi:MAG: beta strand repeat-containing protein [Hormoscilla sp.]
MARLSFNLSNLDGNNGVVMRVLDENDNSNLISTSAGDINGDGIDDLIIGAPAASTNGSFSGKTYVVFGSNSRLAASINLSELNGSNGFILNGISTYNFSGSSVSGAGDINGDGIDDLIIGAPLAGSNDIFSGSSYVVFGSDEGFSASINLDELNGSNGFAIDGANAYNFSGSAVSGAGDINGDGLDDVIIGVPITANYMGTSYVVFGSDVQEAASINLSELNGSNGFALNGISAEDDTGTSVSNAGDINGDGIDDLIIGAPGADVGGSSTGSSYVVFGSDGGFASSINLDELNGSNGFALHGGVSGEGAGLSVSDAGDINGDGIDDLIIGAPGADLNGDLSGSSYVVFGSDGGFSASINLDELNGSNGFAIAGISPGDRVGASVSGAGDINGDGISDLIIGAPGTHVCGTSSGLNYVLFGNDGGFASSINLDELNGSNGFAIDSLSTGNNIGISVSGAGDINGDGIDDLIIDGLETNNNPAQSYVIFGSTDLQNNTPVANSAPVANSDRTITDADTAITIEVLANDTNADGDPICLTDFGSASNGTVSRDDNGTRNDLTDDRLLYSPDSGFTGADSFVYTISDALGSTDTATVNIIVNSENEEINLDIDGNGITDALTDGSLAIRYLFGLRDLPLINNALGLGASRASSEAIAAYLEGGLTTMLDVDGNGIADALTDGILIVRYLFGFTGDSLISGAVALDATRNTVAEITGFLQSFDLAGTLALSESGTSNTFI